MTAPKFITVRRITSRSHPKILATWVTGLGFALGLSVATGAIASSPAPKTQNNLLILAPGFSPDPQVAGVSGGDRATPDCGYVRAIDQPNHVVTLTQPFNFLQASTQSEGDITLLIETPSGRLICSDDVNGLMPEISGEAPAGTYKLWIGDYGDAAANKAGVRAGGYSYRLSLTERNP